MKNGQLLTLKLKELNPYPESVFIPLSEDTLDSVVKILKDLNFSPDEIFGHWGRIVWNNCAEKLSELVEEQESKDRENLIKLVRIARRGSLCWGGITDEMSWKFDIDNENLVIDEYLKTK